MTIDPQLLAREVVDGFIELLPSEVGRQIDKAHREDLELLVREAVREAVNASVERLEEVIRELRSETGRTQLEL
ncbi:MAG: hypothetical protein EP309_01135 [Gammaproteobacteria bacterium]|jgi:hypothetical protein|nr:hypothetical protein [Candidatus Thioaporhodococcus sediminis]TNF57075.1 MAG: hypothetical protein EP309_01135 [Gammaproteobacteria bacterium]